MPYVQLIYQIVYATKYRRHTLIKPGRKELFEFMRLFLIGKGCHVYIINGVGDHLHIITHIHPTLAIATLVKDLKLASTDHIKKEKLFPNFRGWQTGYSAFTYSVEARFHLITYVRNQEAHHGLLTSKEELIKLLSENEVEYDEKFLE